MFNRISALFIIMAVTVALSGCRPQQVEPTPIPQLLPDATVAEPAAVANSAPPPTAVSAPETEAPDTQSSESQPPEASDEIDASTIVTETELGVLGLEGAFPDADEILPTATLLADSDVVPVRELGVGEIGHYVNVTYGYDLRYPSEWFTGFGTRPVLVSFSNLDPGATNRDGMRANGCLIEITASTNTYSFSLSTLAAQSPQTYEGALETDLDGVPAVLMVQENAGQPFRSEVLQVIAHDHFFLLTFEYSMEQEAECRPVWDEMQASWRWFEPDMVPYRNQIYGYSISHPRRWFEYSSTDQGIFISSIDPSTVTSAEELARAGMVIHTHLYENSELLPLREFLVRNIGNLGLTNDVNLGNLLGVRALKDGPVGTEMMTGYFQGPLGRIYVIDILYPANRYQEFRPIANAIIYSFDF